MKGDVAAVVHIGLVEGAASDHRLKHLVGDGAGDSGHRRDEDRAMWPYGFGHAPGHRPLQQRVGLRQRPAQHRKLANQGRQDVAEAIDRLRIGALDLIGRAERLDDKVDRTVLQVQPSVAETGGNGAHSMRTLWCASTLSSVTAREA